MHGNSVFSANVIYQGTSIDGERLGAPRHKISLRSSILITAINNSARTAETTESYLVLQGQLLDVSISGLALIISFNDWLDLKIMGEDLTLHLLLPLPAEAIELDATPVRYEELDENDESGDILVGAYITNMNGRDRIVFMNFIHECEEYQIA